MSEVKKVPLTTVSYDKSKSKCKKECKTIRFNLSLTESNEKSCSEFNYGELLTEHFHKRFVKELSSDDVINGPDLHPSDPFNGRNDFALKSLAKKFEQKYGTTISGKKKKKKSTDFDVLGQGYDESDPFIDNSDALDDVVPKNVDTKYGGFYINAGELDFLEVQISDDDSIPINTKRKKRKLIDSSDDDSQSNKTKKVNGYINNEYDEGERHRQRKKLIHKFNAKKYKLPHSPKEVEENDKPPTGSSVETSIAASIEAVITKARGSAPKEKSQDEQDEGVEGDGDELVIEETSTASSSNSTSSSDDSSSQSESEEEIGEDVKKVDSQVNSLPFYEANRCSSPEDDEIVPLPDNLSQDLISVLDKIKEVGRNSRGSSQKFFSVPAVNKLLLSIEIKLNKLGGGRTKTQIYKHLAGHLPCGMQTIVKRGRNLLSEKLEERLKEPMKRLKEDIAKAMPSLIASYNDQCKKTTEQKVENLQELNGNGIVKKGKNNLPKKKFTFTATATTNLCEVIKVRCQGWQIMKKRNEDPEEHVKSFIEEYVKPLWPKGWISTKLLFKMSQPAHSFITNKKDLVSLPVENIQIPGMKKAIQENEKPTLSYESVELPYHLEKLVKNETAKLNAERLVSTECIAPITAEALVSQNIKAEKKINSDNKQYTCEKANLDLNPVTTKEHVMNPVSVNSIKPLKTNDPIIKVDQTLHVTPDPLKLNSDVKTISSYLSKVASNSDALKERKPPKPSLSATALPKVNNVVNVIELKDKSPIVHKEQDRNTITCITIKSTNKTNGSSKKNIRDLKSTEGKKTVESVNIMDLSVAKNNKLPTSSSSHISEQSDNDNEQVVDLCMKTSPVKNAKLDQEMDKVMNDLLEISRNIQGTPEPCSEATPETPPPKDLISPALRYGDEEKIERVPTKSNLRYADVNKVERVSNNSHPRYMDVDKAERLPNNSLPHFAEKGEVVSNTTLSKGHSIQTHSVITSTNKPPKSYSSEFMDAYKFNKASHGSTETPSIHRQSSISQDIPYKPKTVFQESYLAQRFPTQIPSHPQRSSGATSMSVSQTSASIKNGSSLASKLNPSAYKVAPSNNVGSSMTLQSNIQHTNPTKNIVSPIKNIAEITIHRPSVNTGQRTGTKLSMQPTESVNRLPSTITMHQVSSSTQAESLSRPKISNSSQGLHNTKSISVNFNPNHTAVAQSKPHSTTHFPTNHSIQSLSQSSSGHRYDSSIQSKQQSGQGSVDSYRSNRPNDRPPQKGIPTDPLVNLRLMQGLSVSSVKTKTAAHPTASSSQSASLATSSRKNSASIPDPKAKHGNDKFTKLPSKAVYSNLSAEQMEALRTSSQHQQEFWKHINASGYFTGLSPTEAMRYINQSGQYTGNGSGSSKQGQY